MARKQITLLEVLCLAPVVEAEAGVGLITKHKVEAALLAELLIRIATGVELLAALQVLLLLMALMVPLGQTAFVVLVLAVAEQLREAAAKMVAQGVRAVRPVEAVAVAVQPSLATLGRVAPEVGEKCVFGG
jgi:hypothetical protein